MQLRGSDQLIDTMQPVIADMLDIPSFAVAAFEDRRPAARSLHLLDKPLCIDSPHWTCPEIAIMRLVETLSYLGIITAKCFFPDS